jgi:hypothetical protein
MLAIHSTITGSVPARLASRTRSARCRARRAVSSAAFVLTVAVLLGLASTGCDSDRAVAGPGSENNKDNVPGITAFSIDDLPASLNLSADQRTRLAAAIAEFRQDRQAVGRQFGAGGRGQGPDAAGPRCHGKHDPGARMHRGRRPGRGQGSGGGNGSGPAAGFEPPMIRFVEKSSRILNGDQFVILAQFLAGRRAELRPDPGDRPANFDGPLGHLAARRLGLSDAQQDQLQPLLTTFGEGMRQVRDGMDAGTMTPEQARDRAKELRLALEQGAKGVLTPEQWTQVQNFRQDRRERRSERRDDAQPQRIDRMTGMYIRILGLDDTQASKVRQIMEATVPARRALAERRAQGTIEPEDFAYEMMTIEKNAADQVRGVLTPDQAARFDALRSLLPRGGHLGGPMGGPGGGPMGGPMGPR